jgi:hypothetical protein
MAYVLLSLPLTAGDTSWLGLTGFGALWGTRRGLAWCLWPGVLPFWSPEVPPLLLFAPAWRALLPFCDQEPLALALFVPAALNAAIWASLAGLLVFLRDRAKPLFRVVVVFVVVWFLVGVELSIHAPMIVGFGPDAVATSISTPASFYHSAVALVVIMAAVTVFGLAALLGVPRQSK